MKENRVWLKEKIWPLHVELEKSSSFAQKLRIGSVEIGDYCSFLLALHTIVASMEKSCLHYMNVDFGYTQDIEDELLSLLAPVKKDEEVSILSSKFETLGALYTIQGSMKGGAVISEILGRTLLKDHEFKFYRLREQETQWIEDTINRTVLSDLEKEELYEGSKAVFMKLIDSKI